MTSPYPLPEGCIFREDFTNPKLAADNGCVVTNTAWIPNGGVRPTAGQYKQILVSRLYRNDPPASGTLVFDFEHTADNKQLCVIGLKKNIFLEEFSGSIRFYPSAGSYITPSFAVGRRLVHCTYSTGGNLVVYVDGAFLGQNAFSFKLWGFDVLDPLIVFSSSGSFGGQPIKAGYSFLYYNYVMSAAGVAMDFRRIRGLKS